MLCPCLQAIVTARWKKVSKEHKARLVIKVTDPFDMGFDTI